MYNALANYTHERYKRKLGEGWNSCTEASINKMIKAVAYFKDTVYKALTSWLSQYFIINELGIVVVPLGRSVLEGSPYGFFYTYVGNSYTNREFMEHSFQALPVAFSITAFEFTPYLAAAAGNPSGFNPEQYLGSLSTVIATYSGTTSGGSTGTGTTSGSGTTQTIPNNSAALKQTGLGTAAKIGIGVLVVGAAVKVYTESQKKVINKKIQCFRGQGS